VRDCGGGQRPDDDEGQAQHNQVKPQVIDDEEHERVHDRVAVVDVAKNAGVVCTRMPHRPGPAPGKARSGRSMT
jgi:hypothetical protein